MANRDYYNILNVSKSASQDEIKKAYRKLAMKYHPDRNQGNKDAEAKFKDISEAYAVLSNPEKRKQYDMFGAEGFQQKWVWWKRERPEHIQPDIQESRPGATRRRSPL